MGYVEEGGQKINNGLKINDMMEVWAGNKLTEFRRQQQCEANKSYLRFQEIETKLRVCYLKSAKVKI